MKSSLVSSSQRSLVRFQELLELSCFSWLDPLGPWFSLWSLSHPSSSWEVADVCSYSVSSTCFLLLGSWGPSYLFWFCSLFLPLVQVGFFFFFAPNNFPQEPCGPCVSCTGVQLVSLSHIYKSVWTNLCPLPGSSWDGWGTKQRRQRLSGWLRRLMRHSLNLLKEPILWLSTLIFWSFWGFSKSLYSCIFDFFSMPFLWKQSLNFTIFCHVDWLRLRIS